MPVFSLAPPANPTGDIFPCAQNDECRRTTNRTALMAVRVADPPRAAATDRLPSLVRTSLSASGGAIDRRPGEEGRGPCVSPFHRRATRSTASPWVTTTGGIEPYTRNIRRPSRVVKNLQAMFPPRL